MKVLVTGAAGFIGSHVARRLFDRGHELVVLDHRFAGKCLDGDVASRARMVTADVSDMNVLCAAAEGCDRIFHFAAMVGVDHYAHNPVLTMQGEQKGVESICATALAVGCSKVILASSSAVYGNATGVLTEDMSVAPVSNYAVAKRFGELYLHAQFEENGLQSIAFRIFNVYGPKQNERLVIPRFIRKALVSNPLMINGSGEQQRDFPFIDDVVEAVLAGAEKFAGCEVVNIAAGTSHSIRELAETIIRLTDSRSKLEFRTVPESRRDYEVESCTGSTAKLVRMTGFRPTITLEDGLRRTIDYISAVTAAN